MMTINGIRVIPKFGQLRSIFAFPQPKERLRVEWDDAPTEVDTTEPLLPRGQAISETFGVSPDDWTTIKASLMSNELCTWVIYGRSITIRSKSFTIEQFSERLIEVKYIGEIDTPHINVGTQITDIQDVVILLEGTEESSDTIEFKSGAIEDVAGMAGNLYVSDDNVYLNNQVQFTTKCLVKGKAETIWNQYDSVASTIFAKKTLVQGIECEFTGSSTTDFLQIDDDLFWEFNLTFKTL